MSGGEIQTQLEKPFSGTPTRAAAIRRVQQEPDAAFLLAILGLDAASAPLIIDGQPCCPSCRQPYSGDGRTSCRRRHCELGPTARSIAKPPSDADKALGAEYEAGATIIELARRHRRSQAWVREAILRAGVKMRRAQPRPAEIRPKPTWGAT